MKLRKMFIMEELTYRDESGADASLLSRIVAVAIIENPFAGRDADDLSELIEFGTRLGEKLAELALLRLDGAPTSYGKAAIVGTDGTGEHGAAVLHPSLGKPVRAAIGGGKALMPSNVKVASLGTTIDLPIGHKDEPWLFDYIDTIPVTLTDAPRANEIAVILGLANGPRSRARVGTGPTQ